MEDDDRTIIYNRRPGKVIISKSFATSEGPARIASEVLDGAEGLEFARVDGEVVLRRTPTGRNVIKATFLEDGRKVKSLAIQRYLRAYGPIESKSVTLVGKEIETLLDFLLGIRTVPLGGSSKQHVTNEQLRDILLNEAQARRLFTENEELFVRVAQSEELQRDLVAIGYRRKQLAYFDRLLTDPGFVTTELTRLKVTPEALWQEFFERNTWIFGYGLSYQFITALDGKKLEQVVFGADITGRGKRGDAVMKTQARINSLCFVEIKRHDTQLLGSKPYRPEAWAASAELSGGVSQVQATVQSAVERIGRKLLPTDDASNPTGESLFNVDPRAFLVVGCLDQFMTEHGPNEAMVRSFELYRRNIRRPEILTFDELLHRARFIVEHDNAAPAMQPQTASEADPFDNDVPF